MKTIKINLYEFKELSAEAKERALNDWVNSGGADWIGNDFSKSLEAFSKLFNLNVRDHYQHIYFTQNLDNEITGTRLATWLQNNYPELFSEAKLFGIGIKGRDSKILKQRNECALTGTYVDLYLLQPIWDFVSKPYSNATFKGLMDVCANSFNKAYDNEINAAHTIDYYGEHCEANEYTFEANGKMNNC